MLPEELDRRCAELQARMLAACQPGQPPSDVPVKAGPLRQEKPPKPQAPPVPIAPPPIEPITDPHPLIARTRKGISKEKPGAEGLLHLGSSERLNIEASKQALPRALWVFDALLKAGEARGIHSAIVHQGSAWRTVMVAHGERIPVCMREGTKRVERPRPKKADYWYRTEYDWFPTGLLTFEIDAYQASRRTWNEGSRQRLENCLESIVQVLLATGERLRAERQRREAEEQIRGVEQRQAWADERRAREEKERVEALCRDVDNWHRSHQIRAYLAAFRTSMEKWSGPIQPKTDVGRWLAWAERFADRLDPLKPLCR